MALSGLIVGEAAGTMTSGQRKLDNIGTNRNVFQYTGDFINVSEGVAPLYQLLTKLGKSKTVEDDTFRHLETDYLPLTIETGASAAAGDTVITLASGHTNRVLPNYLIKSPRSKEVFRITSIASATTINVTRGFGGTTAAALNNTEELVILSMADTEGNTAQSGLSSEPSFVQNAVQTFRQPFELSRRDIEAAVYGPKEKVRLLQDASDSLQNQIERQFLFSNSISTSDPTSTAGVEYWVTTNLTDNAGAVLTEDTWNTWLKQVARRNQKNNPNMVLFAGELIRDALDGFGRDINRLRPTETYHGIKCEEYVNSHISVKLMKHGLLSPVGSGISAANDGWQSYAFLLNLDLLGRAVYANSSWRLRSDIEAPGTDGKKWEFLTDEGLYVMNEKAHGILRGVAG